MAITIREVAKQAGVSTAAVSKVLHGRGDSVRVSEEKAAVIRRIAKDLQYRPNALARQLRSSRTHTVGLIFENFNGIADGPLYYMHLLDGAGRVLFPNHYRITILPELDHHNVLGSLGDGQLEGVIWCKLARDREVNRLIHECPIPIVAMNTPPPAEVTDAVFVSCDNEGGIELAVDHLWSLGHRRILFVREGEEVPTPDCIARSKGFADAMRRRGVSDPEAKIATWDWNFDHMFDWAKSPNRDTAILCWSERAGAQILKRAAELGIRVPEELSVVGFDSTNYCETTKPRLTAVRQPIAEMASHASRTLLSMIAGHSPQQLSYTFPCTLDVRDSTAPLDLVEANQL